ncbi:MAG: cytidylate kinase-like family protein [Oscillospiraceae bacterium]|nr:cytidylate kinase-like family protein [Oscillospiraceae bacterium]
MNHIVTVSREFGSGGREVGKRLADALSCDYYDREIIAAIAQESNMDAGYVEHVLDNSLHYSYPLTFSHTLSVNYFLNSSAPQLLGIQNKIIRSLADKSNCVLVGRGADAILEQYKPFRIFVYADLEAKLARCRSRAPADEHLTDRELERKIRQIDKNRADNHDLISAYRWGDRNGYDLCVNTTNVDIKDIVPVIAEYAKAYFARLDAQG